MVQYSKVAEFLEKQNISPQYVRFTTGARNGSIAKVVKVDHRSTIKGTVYISTLTVRWDDRPDDMVIFPNKVEWVEDHTGPTVWSFTRTSKEPAFDKLGVEIEIGMLVLGTSKRKSFVMGTVREITRAKVLVVETIPTKEGEVTREERIPSPDINCVALTEELMESIMVAKLTYG